jgi:hypothetical protein
MKETRFNILIGLVLIAGVGLVCTMAQAAPWCRTIAAQTVPGGPDICMSLVLTDELGSPKGTFALGEPIFARISMDNVGASSIVSSKSFTENKFPLLLLFRDPDGKPITARHLSSQTPPPPPVKYIAGKPTQMDEVEILQPPWGLRVDPFDVRGFYQLTKSGPYRVKLLIPMITYPMAEVKTFSGKKYAKLDSANWSGELESNPASFTIASAAEVAVTITDAYTTNKFGTRQEKFDQGQIVSYHIEYVVTGDASTEALAKGIIKPKLGALCKKQYRQKEPVGIGSHHMVIKKRLPRCAKGGRWKKVVYIMKLKEGDVVVSKTKTTSQIYVYPTYP